MWHYSESTSSNATDWLVGWVVSWGSSTTTNTHIFFKLTNSQNRMRFGCSFLQTSFCNTLCGLLVKWQGILLMRQIEAEYRQVRELIWVVRIIFQMLAVILRSKFLSNNKTQLRNGEIRKNYRRGRRKRRKKIIKKESSKKKNKKKNLFNVMSKTLKRILNNLRDSLSFYAPN